MKIKVITSNEGKMREYARSLGALGYEVCKGKVPYDEIQADTLEEVVSHGLKVLSETEDSFIIDDSGLFINRFDGFPGVYSAYALRTLGNEGLLKLMEGVDDRRASFVCCIGCKLPGRDAFTVSAACEGHILEERRGSLGFGFDPIFTTDGERSFAELDIDDKNRISHRGLAVAALVDRLRSEEGR